MLLRLAVFAGGMVLAAMFLPGLATSYLDRPATDQSQTKPAQASPAKYAGGRGVLLEASAGGHFFGTFTINGRKENGLVDTGASVIAINVSTARRLGISTGSLVFDAQVGTANGVVKAAHVMLDRVEIGTISVKEVDAMVLPDKSLSGMLVGMSFLNKLSSYRVENGALHLTR
ncbi:TIGR02281 family clan AA aspartic protease [Rhizobium herbae]|uniref:Aspartyl protease family protein n=1 Tax=Rhizobium herbae TaxID=508661 RepID=A0ABS4EIY2_9HYPH|nr:TIGR02281 family clan AA aspartic protease [Rhizobium herbae]MBP1857905.1 aspartyl protease family protein [Rhizobium herbae]